MLLKICASVWLLAKVLHEVDKMIDFALSSRNRMRLILSHDSTWQLSVCCWKQVILFSSCAIAAVLKVKKRCRSVIYDTNIDVMLWNISYVASRRRSVFELSVVLLCGDYRYVRPLTTGIRSEICIVRRFRRCANIIECTYTNLDSTV